MNLNRVVWVLVGLAIFGNYCVLTAQTEPKTSGLESKAQINDLAKKVDQLIAEEKYELAIPYLEKAFELSGDNKFKATLAYVCENAATNLAKSGLTNQALAMLEKAKKIRDDLEPQDDFKSKNRTSVNQREIIHAKQFVVDDGDSEVASNLLSEERSRMLFEQALTSFSQKQYGLARGFLEEGIGYYDKNHLAFELLGDIEYFSQNLSAAKSAYENSYKIQQEGRVAEKLQKLAGEMKLESKLSEYLDEHFIIRYNRKEEFRGSEIREYLRDAYRSISRDLGHYLDFKTVVILYGESEYKSISSIPHWSGALFDGKIRIPAYDKNFSRKKLQQLINHELTHVFASDISSDHCPVWLHEGLAEYQENKIIPVDLQLYRLAAISKDLYSAEVLANGVSEETNEVRVHVFYQQSFVIVSSLIEQFRMMSIKRLLQKIEKGASFDEVFKEVFSVSFADYVNQSNQEAFDKTKKSA